MKKIFTLLLSVFITLACFAQSTDASLLGLSTIVKQSAPSSAKIGAALDGIINSKANFISAYTASGTNTYTVTVNPGVVSYITGQVFDIRFTNAPTGTSTLNVNGLGAKGIKKNVSENLELGDILAGGIQRLYYDGTNFQVNIGGGGITAANGLTLTDDEVVLGGTLTQETVILTEGQVFNILTDDESGGISIDNDGDLIVFSNGQTQFVGVINSSGVGLKFNDDRVTPVGLQYAADYTANFGTRTMIDKGFADATYTDLAKYQLDRATPSTAGGTITLDMDNQIQRMHVGSASFAAAKIIALSNTTNSLVFQFSFTVTNVAAVLTMPSNFVMSSPDWNGTDWVPPSTGLYEMGGSFDGTNWFIKIAGPFN